MRGAGKRDGKRARPVVDRDVKPAKVIKRRVTRVLTLVTRTGGAGLAAVTVERVGDRARLRGRADAERVRALHGTREPFKVAGFSGLWLVVLS